MPISLWISVSDRLAIMAPLFTLARHAATYHAGIPTHNWIKRETKTIVMMLLHFHPVTNSMNSYFVHTDSAGDHNMTLLLYHNNDYFKHNSDSILIVINWTDPSTEKQNVRHDKPRAMWQQSGHPMRRKAAPGDRLPLTGHAWQGKRKTEVWQRLFYSYLTIPLSILKKSSHWTWGVG